MVQLSRKILRGRLPGINLSRNPRLESEDRSPRLEIGLERVVTRQNQFASSKKFFSRKVPPGLTWHNAGGLLAPPAPRPNKQPLTARQTTRKGNNNSEQTNVISWSNKTHTCIIHSNACVCNTLKGCPAGRVEKIVLAQARCGSQRA